MRTTTFLGEIVGDRPAIALTPTMERAARLRRHFAEHPDAKFISWTGSISGPSLAEYAKRLGGIPTVSSSVDAWFAALHAVCE